MSMVVWYWCIFNRQSFQNHKCCVKKLTDVFIVKTITLTYFHHLPWMFFKDGPPFSFVVCLYRRQLGLISFPLLRQFICETWQKVAFLYRFEIKDFRRWITYGLLNEKKPSVNFTNILRAAFLYERFMRSFFSTWSLALYFFWRKKIGAKAAL